MIDTSFLSNIDLKTVLVGWLAFEQVLASSDTKANSSFQLLINFVNTGIAFGKAFLALVPTLSQKKSTPKITVDEEDTVNVPK